MLHNHANLLLSPFDFIQHCIKDQETLKLVREILNALGSSTQMELSQDYMSRVFQEKQSETVLSAFFDQLFQKDPAFFQLFSDFLSHYPEIDYGKAHKFINGQLSFESKHQKVLSWSDSIIKNDDHYLYQIRDFMSLDINIDLNKLQDKICENFQKEKKINKEDFMYLLFELIKKRLNFEELIENLYKNFDTTQYQITQMNLLCYLLDNCNSELRSMLFLACSSFMPVPLIANRPFRSQESNEENFDSIEELKQGDSINTDSIRANAKVKYLPKVFEEIIYSYEKYMGVLAFKINSCKDRSLRGCTTLTNKVLNRQFELHSSLAPIANYGQVEMQFDYNFSDSKFVTVAEIHGYLEKIELFTLISQFNIFIIHCFKEDTVEVKSIIERIPQPSLIIIVKQDQDVKQSKCQETEVSKGVFEYKICGFDTLARNHFNQLSSSIKDKIIDYTSQWEKYQDDVPKRLKILQQFAEFCISFNSIHNWNQFKEQIEKDTPGEFEDYNQLLKPATNKFGPKKLNKKIQQLQNEDQQKTLVDTVHLIKKFMENIIVNQKQLKSHLILPINQLYSRVCENENKIQRDLSLQPEKIQKYRESNEKSIDQIAKTKQSNISIEIHKILSGQDSYVGVVSVLAKFIKCIVSTVVDPKFRERARLQDAVSDANIQVAVKSKYAEDISVLTKEIEEMQFSMEFLFREFYIYENVSEQLRLNDPQTIQNGVKPYHLYLQLAQQQITNGQPFEIIDGDNLRFIHGVYQQMQNGYQNSEEILVISVIGPQSSGKSLLLNTLFGTQFQSSAGRCTKGVYGCLIDVKQQDQLSRFKKILILDTEGIQSTEKKDTGFDNRIVFYILCISHIVLVCNKGEINSQMQEMIKIAVYSLSEFKGLVANMPQVNIIMNMISQIDERNLHQTYQNLADSLLKMGIGSDNSHLILNIKKENVFMLPQAFSLQGDYKDLQVNKPSPIFSQKADLLNKNIFQFMRQANSSSMKHTLSSFFAFAAKTWETVNNYHDIDKYSSLDQRQQAARLQQFINDIINGQFKTKMQEVRQRVEEEADKELAKHSDSSKITSHQLFQNIDNKLLDYKTLIKSTLNKQYEEFCFKEGIDKKVVYIYTDTLHRMINTNLIEWQTIINYKIQRYFEEKSNMRGNRQLQNVIETELMKINNIYDDEGANQLFYKHWKIIIKERHAELKDIKTIKFETFENAYHYQRSQVKDFGTKEEDFNLLIQFSSSDFRVESLLHHLDLKLDKDFFYYIGHKKALQPEKFMERFQQIGNYIPQLPYYNQVQTRDLYNWLFVVIERFSFFKLQVALDKELKYKYDKIFNKYNPFIKGSSIIQKIVEKINNEGSKFFIRVTGHFFNALLSIQRTYKDYYKNNRNIEPQFFMSKTIEQIKKNLEGHFEFVNNPDFSKDNFRTYKFFEPQCVIKFETSEIMYYQEYNQNFYTEHQGLSKNQNQFQEIRNGYGELKKTNIQFTANREIVLDYALYNYLNLIQRPENKLQNHETTTIQAKQFFFGQLYKKKIIQEIKVLIIENIYSIQDDPNHITDYDDLLKLLQNSKDINITSQFCPMDMHLFSRIVPEVEKIVGSINTEMETFCLNVHEAGIFSLHQIAQTLITCIYIEIRRINEHAPLFNLEKTEETERKLFVSKLTSKNDERDKSLAERAANNLFKIIKEKAKNDKIEAFRVLVSQYEEFFNVQKIIMDIENYILRVATDFDLGRSAQHPSLLKLMPDQKGVNEEIKVQQMEWTGPQIMVQIKNNAIDHKGLRDRNITWPQIIQMYVEPDIFFKNCFAQSWKIKTHEVIQNFQKDYKDQKIKILSDLIAYFKKFKEKLNVKEINFADSIFIPQMSGTEGGEGAQKKYQQTCNKAFSNYLRQILLKQWDQSLPQIIDGVEVIVDPAITLVHHDDLKLIILEQDHRNSLASSLENEMISNFKIFVDELIQCFEKEKTQDLVIDESVIIQNTEHLMRQQSTGCNQLCPLCRRKCDKIHQERQDQKIHSCSATGHQIIGFGGSFHARINYAITYGCHELEDNDMVQHEDVQKRWGIFKTLFQQWDFMDDQKADKKRHKEDNIKVWNLIGPIICEYYQKNVKNCKITFTKADQNAKRMGRIENIMYILVLDSSGSMYGKKWDDVIAESKRFLGLLSSDQNLKDNSKVSIITYSSEAVLCFENQVPNQQFVDNIKYIGSMTDFDKPLMMVKDLAVKYLKDFDGFHVCFLSDGEAGIPTQAINQIKENDELMSKFRITTVAFKDEESEDEELEAEELDQSSYQLKEIAASFGESGSFRTALAPEDFKNALIEMIPIIYRNPIA